MERELATLKRRTLGYIDSYKVDVEMLNFLIKESLEDKEDKEGSQIENKRRIMNVA